MHSLEMQMAGNGRTCLSTGLANQFAEVQNIAPFHGQVLGQTSRPTHTASQRCMSTCLKAVMSMASISLLLTAALGRSSDISAAFPIDSHAY